MYFWFLFPNFPDLLEMYRQSKTKNQQKGNKSVMIQAIQRLPSLTNNFLCSVFQSYEGGGIDKQQTDTVTYKLNQQRGRFSISLILVKHMEVQKNYRRQQNLLAIFFHTGLCVPSLYTRGSRQSASFHSLVTGKFCIMKQTKCRSTSNKIQQVECCSKRSFQKIKFFQKKKIVDMYLKNGDFCSGSTASSALAGT